MFLILVSSFVQYPFTKSNLLLEQNESNLVISEVGAVRHHQV